MLCISPIIEWNIFLFFFFGQKLNRIPWTNPIDERSFQCKFRFKVELNVSSGKKKKRWNLWTLTIVLQSKIYSRIFTKKFKVGLGWLQCRWRMSTLGLLTSVLTYPYLTFFCFMITFIHIFLFYDHIYSLLIAEVNLCFMITFFCFQEHHGLASYGPSTLFGISFPPFIFNIRC